MRKVGNKMTNDVCPIVGQAEWFNTIDCGMIDKSGQTGYKIAFYLN
jgi:hypothetical protein